MSSSRSSSSLWAFRRKFNVQFVGGFKRDSTLDGIL
jgi:hypothetical protein